MIDLADVKQLDEYKNGSPQEQSAMLAHAQRFNNSLSPRATVTPADNTVGEPQGIGEALGNFGKAAVGSLIGHNPTEYAATAGTLGMDAMRAAGMLGGGPLTRAASILVPPLVAAGVGAMTGPDKTSGALQGLATGALQTLPAGIGAALVNRPVGKMMERLGLANLLKAHFPSLAADASPKIVDLEALLRGTKGERLAGDALNATKAQLTTSLEGQRFAVPALVDSGVAGVDPSLRDSKFLPFEQADDLLTKLRHRGSTPNGDARTSISAPELRQFHHEGVQQLIDGIAEVDPLAAQQYADAREQFAQVQTLKNGIFNQKDAIKQGHINLPKVQEIILEDPALRSKLDSSEFGKDFLKWAFRGDPPVATDVPASLGLRFFMGHLRGLPTASLHAPTLGSTVGSTSGVPFLKTLLLAPVRAAGDALLNPSAPAESSLPMGADELAARAKELIAKHRQGLTPTPQAIRTMVAGPDSTLSRTERSQLRRILPPAPLPTPPGVR
jgi:hypothetical protein